MTSLKPWSVALIALLAASAPGSAQTADELAAIRAELAAIRTQQEAIQKDLAAIKTLLQIVMGGRDPVASAGAPSEPTPIRIAGRPTRGAPGATLVIVEFSDYAVSNEALCKISKRRSGWACDDMSVVDRQIQAAKDFEWIMDWLDDAAINGSGWYRIAYSPQQARQHIRNGKLAVVVGIEVDSLFGCKLGTGCSHEYLDSQLNRYYSMGSATSFPFITSTTSSAGRRSS